MSRYTGPRLKKMRALGTDLPGLSRKSIERRPHAPGQHGPERRRKLSDFGVRLIEKQKFRFNYGLTESQVRRLMDEALRARAVTGDRLLELAERRLDSVVFRAGFAPTIPAARQLVSHGHITVNGTRVDRPSFRVDVGDRITLHARSREHAMALASLADGARLRPPWLAFDEGAREAAVQALPTADTASVQLDTRLIVEFYSRSL